MKMSPEMERIVEAESRKAEAAMRRHGRANGHDEPPLPGGPEDYEFAAETESEDRADSGDKPSRFRLVPFNNITASSDPAHLVKGIIPAGGLVVVWGPPKCGKSFWTFDLLMHPALGWEYRGRRVQHGGIVYVALEGGKGFHSRVQAFRQRFMTDEHRPVPFWLITDPINLVKDHADLIASIRAQVGDNHPAAVAIDTLNRSLAGSESDDKDMAAYIRAADAIRSAFGCAVIIVHHCGVDGTRPRGHTSLTGAVDAQLAVKRDAAGNIAVTVEWMKDGPDGDSFVSRLETVEVGTDVDGEPMTSCVIVPMDGPAVSHDRGPRLSPRDELARRELANLLCDTEARPSCVPSGGKAVPYETWRAASYRKGFGDDGTPEARKKAFKRMSDKLQQFHIIGRCDEWVWLAPAYAGTGGQWDTL